MPEPRPYETADKTIISLNRRAIRRFEAGKRRLVIADFDELSVISEIKAIYEGLDDDNRKAFRQLFIDKYNETRGEKEDSVEEMAEMYLGNLLETPDPLTHYVYETEVLRKRDRTAEAVNAVSVAKDKLYEMKKGLSFWSQMTAWYVDEVSDGATLKAFYDMGIEYVQWHISADDKVCSECRELNGEIFPIDRIPTKPHLGCRCYLTPVKRR